VRGDEPERRSTFSEMVSFLSTASTSMSAMVKDGRVEYHGVLGSRWERKGEGPMLNP
jgi:hypothetical protein